MIDVGLHQKTIIKEYKIAKGFVIFIYIAAPLLIVLFSWLLIMPFVLDDISIELSYFFIPLSIGMIGLMIAGLIDTKKGKIIVSTNALTVISLFSNRELKFHEIDGYKEGENYIFVIPNTKEKKRLKISKYIGEYSDFKNWLNSNFSDLNQIDKENEKVDILRNLEYGINEEERSLKLNQAKKVAKALNWAGGFIFFWILLKPEPYKYAISASILFPILAVFVVIYYKGLIRIDEKKGSIYPTVFFAISMTTCGLFFRVFFDYDIFDYSNIWTSSIAVGIIMIALVIFGTKEFKFQKINDYFSVLYIAIIFFMFSYSSVLALNCTYDDSIPQAFQSKILDKRISKHKYISTYYLEVAAWGTQTENEDVSVSKELYEKLEIDDNVNIYLKRGLFKIPWFTLTECDYEIINNKNQIPKKLLH